MGKVIPISGFESRHDRLANQRRLNEAAVRIHVDAKLVLFEAELGGDERMIEAALAVLQHTQILFDRRKIGEPTDAEGSDEK